MRPGRGENVVLTGMPGAGKSTIGVLLAKELLREFLDTDLYIQACECRRLQQIINAEGVEAFRAIEERYLLSLDAHDRVIATGGSAVYSAHAMEHLASNGCVVFLALTLESLKQRISDMGTRGIVMQPGQTFDDLYHERQPLYRQYAQVTVDCNGLDHNGVLAAVLTALGKAV